MEFTGPATPLSDADIAAAAAELGIEVAVIYAVDEVESRGKGFLPDTRPQILFERHVFSRRTHRAFDALHPGISHPSAGGYGQTGAHQYTRLHEAIALDRDAALRSASWGRYQVMGFNAELCGWPDVESYVADACKSEAEHLRAFIGYCRERGIVGYLRSHDWRAFTSAYNGPGNVDEYSAKLEAAYHEHAGRRPADLPMRPISATEEAMRDAIRSVQSLLNLEGVLTKRDGSRPGLVDGDPGPQTIAALTQWRREHPA